MEAALALDLVKEMHSKSNGSVHISQIVSDDDSTMRSLIKHKECHDKGQLPISVPQPVFLADPSHRIKVMSKLIF